MKPRVMGLLLSIHFDGLNLGPKRKTTMKSPDNDPRSRDLKHLRIEPVEVSRTHLTSATAAIREMRVSLPRVKFRRA